MLSEKIFDTGLVITYEDHEDLWDNQKDILARLNNYEVIRVDCSYYYMNIRDEICKNAIINIDTEISK